MPDNFDPVDPLGPEFGGINQPGTNPQSYKPFEGEELTFPKVPTFLPSSKDLTLPHGKINNLVKTNGQGMSNKDFNDAIQSAVKAGAYQSVKPKGVKLFAYDASPQSNAFYKRYAAFGDETFGKIGFSPFRDNDAIYNENTTWGQRWSRSMTEGFWPLFKSGFVSGPKSLVKMMNGDFSPDLEHAEIYGEAAAIATDTKGGFGSFFNNTAMNFGYTAGIIVEALAEEAIGFLLAAPTGGSSFALTTANVARNLGRIGKGVKAVDYTADMARSLKQINNISGARNFFKAATSRTGRFINPLENVTDAAYDIYKNKNNLTGLAKFYNGFSKTAGGFYRDVRAINMALAEARLEGGFVENELYDEFYNNYYNEKGVLPDNDQQKLMVQDAKEAGMESLGWNSVLIYASNKIVIPNIVGPRGGIRKFMGSKMDEVLNLKHGKILRETEETILKSGRKYKKPKFTWEAKGLKSTLKDIKRDPFGQGLIGLGSYFRRNVTEGLQENAQEIIADATKEYYLATFDNEALRHHLSRRGFYKKALSEQFTAQGFETFASGFFMGMFAGPLNQATPAMSLLYNKTFNKEEYHKYKKARNEYGEGIAAELTNLGSDPKQFFNSRLFNYAKQADISNELADPESINSMRNAEDESLINQVNTAIDNDQFDHFIEHIESLKDLTTEEFAEALGFDNIEEAAKRQGDIDGVIKQSKSIAKRHKFYDEKFPDTINLEGVEHGSEEYITGSIYKEALKISKKNAVFFGESFDNATQRMHSIAQKLTSELPNNVKASDIHVLFKKRDIINEVGLLETEIESLKLSEDPKVKTQIKEKEDKLKALKNYEEALERYDKLNVTAKEAASEGDIVLYDETRQHANTLLEAAYKQYMRTIGKLADSHIFDENLEESFTELKDFYKLSDERDTFATWINFLHDPQNFLETVHRNNQWMTEAYHNRKDYYDKIVENFQRDVETNALLNTLADEGIYISSEDLKKFREEGKIPEEFFDNNTKTVIKSGIGITDQRLFPAKYLEVFLKFKQALELQESSRHEPTQRLKEALEALEKEKQAKLDALPKIDQKKVLDKPIKPNRLGKLNIKSVHSQLEDGEYAEVTLTKVGKKETHIFYKEGENLRYDNIDGEIVNLKDIKEKFDSATRFIIEKIPNPEQAKEIEEEYAARKEILIQDYQAEVTEGGAFVPQFVSVTDSVESLPETLKSQLQSALDESIAEEPEVFSNMDLQSFMVTPTGEDIINAWNDKQAEMEEAHREGVVERPVIFRGDKEEDTSKWTEADWNAQIELYKDNIKALDTPDATTEDRNKITEYKAGIIDIQKYLRYKKISDVPAPMQRAIDLIKHLQSMQSSVRKTADEKFYIINGKRQSRVTKSYEGLKKDSYTYIKQEDAIALWKTSKNSEDFIKKLKDAEAKFPGVTELTYEKLLRDVEVINSRLAIEKSPEHTKIREQIKNINAEIDAQEVQETDSESFKQYEEQAQAEITKLRNQLPLTEKQAEKEFIKALQAHTYEEGRVRGNTIDNLAKRFFNEPTWTPSLTDAPNMSEEAFNNLFGPEGFLTNLRSRAEMGEYYIASEGLVVWDSQAYSIDTEGNLKQTGIAGEIDLLIADREGNVMIVDIKTGDIKKWKNFDKPGNRFSKLEDYRLQQSTYKNLLYNMTGLDASIHLLPLLTETEKNTGKILSAQKAAIGDPKLGKAQGDFYELAYDERVEQIVPRKGPGEVVPEDVTEPKVTDTSEEQPLTEEEIKSLGIEIPTVEESLSDDIESFIAILEQDLAFEEGEFGNPQSANVIRKQIKDLKKGLSPTELKVFQERRAKAKQAPTPVSQIDEYESLPLFKDMEGKQVMFNGKAYILKKVNRKRNKPKYILQSHVNTIELDASPWQSIEEYDLDLPNRVAQQRVSKYTTQYLTEDDIIINNVKYKVKTNETGNVIGLSPSNKPEQIITNKAMLIAADIERARYNYNDAEDLLEVSDEDIIEELSKIEQDIAYTHLSEVFQNMNSVVSGAIEKIHKRKPLTDAEMLQADLFLTDAIIRIRNLYYGNPLEMYGNMLDTLESLQILLYTSNPNFYEQGRQKANTDELAERSKSITQKEVRAKEQTEKAITRTEELPEEKPKVNVVSLEGGKKALDNLNTAPEVDELVAGWSRQLIFGGMDNATMNLLQEYANNRKDQIKVGISIGLNKDNISINDELVVKKDILKGDKIIADKDLTVTVTKITKDKITLKPYNRSKTFTINTNDIGEFLTSISLEEIKDQSTTELNSEDKKVIKEDIDAYTKYLGELMDIESAHEKAKESNYLDLKEDLLNDLEC